MAPLLQELDGILADKAHPVTARWLCYQHGVGVAEAQNALAKCAESSTSKVAVTYLLTGARLYVCGSGGSDGVFAVTTALHGGPMACLRAVQMPRMRQTSALPAAASLSLCSGTDETCIFTRGRACAHQPCT